MPGDPSDQPPPMLDYAVPPPLREAIDLDRHVEHLIADGAGPTDLRKYFRRTKDVVTYFCEVIGRLRGKDAMGDRCVDCGSEAGSNAVQLGWRVEMRIRNFDFVLTRQTHRPALVTWHALCDTCADRWKKQLRWDGFRWLMMAILVAWVWLMVVGGAARLLFGGQSDLARGLSSLLFIATASLASHLEKRAHEWVLRRLRPPALVRLMPSDVRFVRCGGFFVRNQELKSEQMHANR